MAKYPDWVMEHKKKGTYINYKNGKYYLYAAHSERMPGTGKVKRVFDRHLGRITEEGGFIPSKKKLPDEIYVYEHGLSETILSLCAKVHSGLKREFRINADYVMAGGILLFMHGMVKQEFYESSWLSIRIPGLDMDKAPTDKQRTGMERTQRMIKDTLTNRFGESYDAAAALLPLVRAVRAGGETAIAAAPAGVTEFLNGCGIYFGEVQNG